MPWSIQVKMAILQNWTPEDSGYIELKALLGCFGSIGIRIRCSVHYGI
jgi:hypothetical protein